MPIYEVFCGKCGSEEEVLCKFSELSSAKCQKCDSLFVQQYRTPRMATIPASFSYDGNVKCVGSPKGHSKALRLPINFIDKKPDGGYRVTRIASNKKDLES